MLIIGHRGAPGLEPENTISSFKKAEAIGVDMIEMDLRLSRDGQIVVIHDKDMIRNFGIDVRISDLTLRQIKDISINAKREIPSLEEVLNQIHIPMNFHVKVSGMEAQILKLIKKFSAKALISSVQPRILKKIRALDGNIRLGLIIGRGELHLLPVINFLIRNINLYSVHPKNILVSRPTLGLIRWQKRKIFPWTINHTREYERMAKLGVDGVITDHPEKFL